MDERRILPGSALDIQTTGQSAPSSGVEINNETHSLHFGLDGLDRIRNAYNETTFSGILFDMARDYAPYLGVDFDTDILPNLGDADWWQADYGVSEIDGRAIGMSIKDAFRCLVDTHRTFQIAQGIKETVSYLKQNKTEPLTAIDAGTGTGVLSILLVAYGVDTIYAIEYNHETFEATQNFLQRAGLDGAIHIVEGDATTVQLKNHGVDVLVSENLSAGLMDEPQYDIIAHLSQYLSPDAKILPYRARLSVSLADADWDGIPPEKNEISTIRLKRCEQVSGQLPYAQVDSRIGMSIPTIEGHVTLPLVRNKAVNTLVISTAFRINEVGTPIYLEPDAAEFLGKSRAFRMVGEVGNVDAVDVVMRYRTGRLGEYINVISNGNAVVLSD